MWWSMVWLAAFAGDGFDHEYAAFASFLSGAVSDSGVAYDTLAGRRELLDQHLSAIAAADVDSFSRAQKLAFYVNAYNGYTLKLILDERPKSIRDLDGGDVWKVRKWAVAGGMLTLDQMEHTHARQLADGRVHAVVNCASKGCPPLPPKPLRASGLESQLDQAARRWVRTNAFVQDGGTVRLNKIFDWYATDFTKWATEDLAAADDKQDAAIGFLRAYGGEVAAEAVAWNPYDWSLNQR
jgi:hypothetical protein